VPRFCSLALVLILLSAQAWAQDVTGRVISGTRFPGFWVIQVYGSSAQPGEVLEGKRDGWRVGQARVTRVQGRLLLVRCTEGDLQVGDVLVPTGLDAPLTRLDMVATIPPGLETPRPRSVPYRPRPATRSRIAMLGGGTSPSRLASTSVSFSPVRTAPFGEHNLDFERRTGQTPFAQDSRTRQSAQPGDVLSLGTYLDVEGRPLTATWVVETRDRYLRLTIDGVPVILDKFNWYTLRNAVLESAARRQDCAKGRAPVTLVSVPAVNGGELLVKVVSSTESDYGWSALSADGRQVRFTDRGYDRLGDLNRLLTEVGRYWRTE
jgi:hypothetical protein